MGEAVDVRAAGLSQDPPKGPARVEPEGTRIALRKDILRVVLPYVALAALWIYTSDTVLSHLVSDPARTAFWATFKGWLFVAVTGGLLWVLLSRLLSRLYDAQSETRNLNTGLERRVTERTAQLEAANKELEAFCYSVSHDLRAPLRAVDGFSAMLAEQAAGQLDAEGQRLLGVIRNETARMGRLIDDLLAFSQLGRRSMRAEWVDLNELARAAFEECAAKSGRAAARVSLALLPPVRADAAMMRQALLNLFSNALKYTRPVAQPVIEMGCRAEAGELIYWVKDNGVGFDARYAHKLFGVFQRLHTDEQFEGTGVGLALVQRIIQRHGGRVWAESRLNEGATFYFSLPASN